MSDTRRPDPSDEEAWEAIVADLSGQLGTPPVEEYDYIDAYFDEGYTPPEPPPIGIAAAITGFAILVARRERHVPPGEDHGDGAVV
jgi:hypothetical protein